MICDRLGAQTAKLHVSAARFNIVILKVLFGLLHPDK
jgi:hypothetical protein